MALDESAPTPSGGNTVLRIILLAVAAVYILVSLYLILDSRSRLEALEKSQPQFSERLDKMGQRADATDRNVKASTEELAQRLGMTQQELQSRMSARTAELDRQQKAAEKRLGDEQKAQISQVTGEVREFAPIWFR